MGHKLIPRHARQPSVDLVIRFGCGDVTVIPCKAVLLQKCDGLVQCSHSHRVTDLLKEPPHHIGIALLIALNAGLNHALTANHRKIQPMPGIICQRFQKDALRAAIAFPPAGLLIFQTDDPSGLYYYNGTSWFTAGGSPSPVGGKVSTLSPGFSRPTGVAGDGNGNVYVADQNNHRIYKIVTATSVVSTLAGSGTAGFADGAGATA